MLLLILLYFLGRAAASSMQGPFLVDSGFSLADIGLLKGSIGVAAGLGGSVAASYFVGKMSRDRALASAATLQALAQKEDYAALDALLQPPQSALGDMPGVCISQAGAFYIRQGQALQVPGAPSEGMVKMSLESGEFLGIAEILDDGRVAPRRLVVGHQG